MKASFDFSWEFGHPEAVFIGASQKKKKKVLKTASILKSMDVDHWSHPIGINFILLQFILFMVVKLSLEP